VGNRCRLAWSSSCNAWFAALDVAKPCRHICLRRPLRRCLSSLAEAAPGQAESIRALQHLDAPKTHRHGQVQRLGHV
jgi:hypothetical protein